MNDRRKFLGGLLALPVVGVGGTGAAAAPKLGELVLQESAVAGFQYHQGERAWPHLKVGEPLELVREPDNPYDPRATAVYWGNLKLGYVPRAENATVSVLLDQRAVLRAQILQLRQSPNPWARVLVEISLPWVGVAVE